MRQRLGKVDVVNAVVSDLYMKIRVTILSQRCDLAQALKKE